MSSGTFMHVLGHTCADVCIGITFSYHLFLLFKHEKCLKCKKLCSFCEGLVHDEHLQHQGWAAIMANLEDCSNSYQKLLFKFESIYSNYLQSVEDIKLKETYSICLPLKWIICLKYL